MEKKLRAPDTIEDAVVQAKALLGEGALVQALDVSGSLITKWSDHDDTAHRIGCHQALIADRLLIESGHMPVFAALFERQRPAPVMETEKADPVQLAMRATTDAAMLMDDTAKAAARGEISPASAILLRAEVRKLQGDLGKLVRSLARHTPPVVAAVVPDTVDTWALSKATTGRTRKTRTATRKRR